MNDALLDVIRKITERGWRVHFEGFERRQGDLYFTITTKGVPYSASSGAVSRYELTYSRLGASETLALKMERAFEELKRIEKNPYGRNPETDPTEAEQVHGDI